MATKKKADFKPEVVAPKAPSVPKPDEVKQVIFQIVQQFIAEEKDNKVTRNNMAGLIMQLNGAVDGQITIKQQEGTTP